MAAQIRSDREAPSGGTSGHDAVRCRPSGRIGGIVGHDDERARAGLAKGLGRGSQVLGGDSGSFVADFDACWVDAHCVESAARWEGLVHDGKLPSVSGAFAVAWRNAGGAVCLARDHIGERSVFYAQIGAGLVFGSDLRGVLSSGLVSAVIDHTAVARYLSYGYLPGRDTLLSGVHKLLPAEVVEFRDGALSSAPMWSLPEGPREWTGAGEGLLRAQLRAELEAAVTRRLPRRGPVGVFLSGGIDSSLVVALARRLHAGDVHTYSVSF
jgi:asparagine synthase (glutamine-hydrolysing)